jgi:hypothetical protein
LKEKFDFCMREENFAEKFSNIFEREEEDESEKI